MTSRGRGIKLSTGKSVTTKRKTTDNNSTQSPPTITAPSSGTCDSVLSPSEGTSLPKKNKSDGRSLVWDHFTKLKDLDEKETGRARCNYCENEYGCNSVQGTSGLWKHLRSSCQSCPIKNELVESHKKKDKKQKILNFHSASDSVDGKLSCWNFDQQAAREALVKFIVWDEHAFRFVEGEGFKKFIEVVVPWFNIPSRFTIARDCYSLFVKEKKRVKELLQSNCKRVSLTTDTWTSIQNVNYLCLTGHFIDSDWMMQKRILNFCVIKSHKGVNIGNAIEFCMDEWALDKVMCITVDNASSNDTAIAQLKKKLLKKNAFVLGGDAFQMRCFCHILQLIVNDGLEIADKSVKKIRNVVRYVRASPQRLDLFQKCCDSVNIKCKASLILDCKTRWNSTYLMLETALRFQKAFDELEDMDEKFVIEFGDELPDKNDWLYAAHLTKCLKRFYDVTCKLSGSQYATSNMYFPEVIRILKDLESFQRSDDLCLREMGNLMREKFDKYWGTMNKMNVMLFIAVVLDPRYKMRFLKVKYEAHYSEKDAKDLVDRVTISLKTLIEDHRVLNEESGDSDSSPNHAHGFGIDTIMEDDVDEFFLEEENQRKAATKDELDRYLEEAAEAYTRDFNILLWWKVNSVRYPNLSCVARDVLAIQSSTVASESAFSTGGRTLDRFRSSLTPTTAEVLICSQDWLRNSKPSNDIEELVEDMIKLEIGATEDPEIKESISGRIALEC